MSCPLYCWQAPSCGPKALAVLASACLSLLILQLHSRALGAGAGAGAVREYFIAALEGVWDYAPAGTDNCGAKPAQFTDAQKGFIVPSSTGFGRRQFKALYVEFTDATFTVRKARPPAASLPRPAALLHIARANGVHVISALFSGFLASLSTGCALWYYKKMCPPAWHAMQLGPLLGLAGQLPRAC